jgi:hypothetical protein
MKYEPFGGGLIYEPKESDYIFGSGQLTAPVVRPDGNWTDYLPENEEQKKYGVETSACATFATINSIEILMEEMGFGKDFDYSERFISLLSETTKQGNSPTKVADTIRKYGLIPETMMPFDSSIESWEDFNSWKGADKELCLTAGQQWLKKYTFNYDIGWRGDISPEDKQKIIKDIAKFCPPPVSVMAWYSDNGIYKKPKGSQDNHLTLRAKQDTVFDTYEPFLKQLEPNYDHLMVLRVVVSKKKEEVTLLQKLVDLFRKLFNRDYRIFGAERSPKWRDVRREHITKNPTCAVCGRVSTLLEPNQVHHIKVFWKHPELECEPTNLITLCRIHHLEWGHYFSFRSWNENVVKETEEFRNKIKNRP